MLEQAHFGIYLQINGCPSYIAMQKVPETGWKMKTFRQYLEGIDGDKNPITDLGMSGAMPEESLVRIARLAAKDHRDELMDFFQTLASKDHAIRHELDNMNRNDANRNPRPKGKSQSSLDNRDEVVPHAADGLSGVEPGDGQV